jgi:hypothetical protein
VDLTRLAGDSAGADIARYGLELPSSLPEDPEQGQQYNRPHCGRDQTADEAAGVQAQQPEHDAANVCAYNSYHQIYQKAGSSAFHQSFGQPTRNKTYYQKS